MTVVASLDVVFNLGSDFPILNRYVYPNVKDFTLKVIIWIEWHFGTRMDFYNREKGREHNRYLRYGPSFHAYHNYMMK